MALHAKRLKASEALWTFVRVEGVEPTNNCGESSADRCANPFGDVVALTVWRLT